MYIHEITNWPHFEWEQEKIDSLLIEVRHEQGRLMGRMDAMGSQIVNETNVQTLTEDVVKSSAIEGAILDPSLVHSSIARHLGMESKKDDEKRASKQALRDVEGVVEMMLDATQNYDKPFTKKRLFKWHEELFPTGRSGYSKIETGRWRSGIVQVVSGRFGREKIHFEAPPAKKVEKEMECFLDWINQEKKIDPVLKAAIAHFWFVTIHPFDDGNGRIARAIGDMMLARSEKTSKRYYSLSSQIQLERKSYYTILENSQKSTLNITPWILWFLECLKRAIHGALHHMDKIVSNAKYLESLGSISINPRQKKIIHLLLEGFDGKLTTSKWAKITKCSQDTAHRDIVELINLGIIEKSSEGGRSTSYLLKLK